MPYLSPETKIDPSMTGRQRREFTNAITPLLLQIRQASHETYDLIVKSPAAWYYDPTMRDLAVQYPPVLSEKERVRARVMAAAEADGVGWDTEGIDEITNKVLREKELARERAWRAAKAKGEWALDRFWVEVDRRDLEQRARTQELKMRRQRERELVHAAWDQATNATKRMRHIATKHLRQAYLNGMRYSEIVIGLQQNPPLYYYNNNNKLPAVTKGLSSKIQLTAKSTDFRQDGHGINEVVFDLVTDMVFQSDSLTETELINPNAIQDLAHAYYIAAFNSGVIARFGDRVNYRYIAPVGCCPECALMGGLVFPQDYVKDRIAPDPMRIGCLGTGIWQPTFDLESLDSDSEGI